MNEQNTHLYFWDAEESPDYPPTEEQLSLFPAYYEKRYRNAKKEKVRQQAAGSATLLAMHLGVTSDDDLERDSHGRLSLQDNYRHISLSHTGSVSVLAVSDRPVGVDLETIRDVPEAIAGRFFPPTFQTELAAASHLKRAELFFLLWTRLEAALKADGRGLNAPRSEFERILARYDFLTSRDGDLIWSVATEKIGEDNGAQS